MNALLKQAAKDYYEYFVKKRFEISYSQKIESDKFIAHQNEIWGKCFVVSETMYVMALEAAEHYSSFVNEYISDKEKKEKQYTFFGVTVYARSLLSRVFGNTAFNETWFC